MAAKRYISNVFVDNADDLFRLKRGNRRRHALASGSRYWTPQADAVLMEKLLFWGKNSEISGGQMPNKVTGSTDYITVVGSADNETYQLPNTAPYSGVAEGKWHNEILVYGDHPSTIGVDYNIRNIIPANSCSNNGLKVRLLFYSKDGNGIITGASIGVMTTGQTFDSAPTRVTFDGGSSSTIVVPGTVKVSDEITFAFDKTKRYGIHVFSTQRQYLDMLTTGTSESYYGGSGDNTLTLINQGSTGAKFQMFNGLEVLSNVITTEELVSFDFSQLLIKYNNITPYIIREIVIPSEALTTEEENHLRDYCDLSVWWSNVLSSFGNLKENKRSGKVNFNGTNLIVNGNFSIDSLNPNYDFSWIKDVGFTIAGGKVNISTAVPGGIRKTISLVVGEVYRVCFEITDYTSGSINFFQDFTIVGIRRNSVGVFIEDFIYATGAQPGRTELRVQSNFIGSVDNFSLIKIS